MSEENLNENNSPGLYTENQVCRLIGVTRSTLWRFMYDNKYKTGFPEPIYLNPKCQSGKRWIVKEVHAYIEYCIKLSRGNYKQEVAVELKSGSDEKEMDSNTEGHLDDTSVIHISSVPVQDN